MPTHPQTMPFSGVAETNFEIMHNQALNETRGGGTFATQLGPDYWQADITTTNLERRSDRFAAWGAFLDAARGALKTVLLYDAERPYPRHYPSFAGLVKAGTATPFVGNGSVYTDIIDRYSAPVNGLPANFMISRYDYVSFVQSGRYSLHRVVDDAQANSSGVVTINVEPAIPTFIDSGATADFHRALGEFIIDASSIRRPRGLEARPFSFSARSRAL